MDRKQAEDLWRKYREGRATAEEIALIESAYLRLTGSRTLPTYDRDEVKTEMWNVIRIQRKRLWWRRLSWVGVAAAGILLFFVGLHFYVDNQQTWKPVPAAGVAPGGNKATLTLADGTKVDLSSTQDGIIVGGDEITYVDGSGILDDGQQTIDNRQADGKERLMSDVSRLMSLTTPKGGTYQITLPDGTKVWLNANSTLQYPERFAAERREVILNGEAFFKVRHQALPFIVRTSRQLLEVLGTEFNITAYEGESEVKTTLVEGSVRVSSGDGSSDPRSGVSRLLTPGQQSILSDKGFVLKEVDIEAVTAWSMGYFKFSGTLEEILQQISRWYEVDIQFRENSLKQQRIFGYANRNTSLSEVLHILEAGSDARFAVEAVNGHSQERRVVVMK